MNKSPEEIDSKTQEDISFLTDMDTVLSFVGLKGRYEGKMFIICIHDLADIIRNMEKKR